MVPLAFFFDYLTMSFQKVDSETQLVGLKFQKAKICLIFCLSPPQAIFSSLTEKYNKIFEIKLQGHKYLKTKIEELQ